MNRCLGSYLTFWHPHCWRQARGRRSGQLGDCQWVVHRYRRCLAVEARPGIPRPPPTRPEHKYASSLNCYFKHSTRTLHNYIELVCTTRRSLLVFTIVRALYCLFCNHNRVSLCADFIMSIVRSSHLPENINKLGSIL